MAPAFSRTLVTCWNAKQPKGATAWLNLYEAFRTTLVYDVVQTVLSTKLCVPIVAAKPILVRTVDAARWWSRKDFTKICCLFVLIVLREFYCWLPSCTMISAGIVDSCPPRAMFLSKTGINLHRQLEIDLLWTNLNTSKVPSSMRSSAQLWRRPLANVC